MRYPRKSYPHRFSPPCAKRSRPRACARVYIIYRSPVGRSRGVSAPLWGRGRAVVAPCPAPPSAGWGRARAKADAPSRSAPYLPAYGRAPAACVPNHCAQRRSAQGNPRSCPCVLPASACLRPRPCPLMGEAPSAKAEVHKAIPAPARAFSPRRLVYGRALCPLMGEAPCVLPAPACLRPNPRPQMGEVPSAGWGRAKAKADVLSHSNPHLPAYRRAPAA